MWRGSGWCIVLSLTQPSPGGEGYVVRGRALALFEEVPHVGDLAGGEGLAEFIPLDAM